MSRATFLRSRLGLAASLVTLALGACNSSANMVEKAYVLDLSSGACDGCESESEARELLALASLRPEGEPAKWVAERLSCPFPWNVIQTPLTCFTAREWSFDLGDELFQYTIDPCRVWDCYKSYLALEAAGHTLWRRRVPFVNAPVVPFVVGRYLLYIGHRGRPETVLVALDRRSGRTVGLYTLPSVEPLCAMNPPGCYPFFREGYVVFQPAQWVGGSVKESHRECGSRVLLLKLGLAEL